MSILTPTIAPTFGALDSDVYADGAPVDAHVLRTLASSANRLTCRGEPICNLVWNASTETSDAETLGAYAGVGFPFWFRLTPAFDVSKKPGHQLARLIVRAKLRASEELLVQVATRKRPFDAGADDGSPNVVLLTGTGADEYTTDDTIELDIGDSETISFWALGRPTSTLASSIYGTPNTGTITETWSPNFLIDTSSTWNNSAFPPSFRNLHCVVITDAAGNELTRPRVIHWVDYDGRLHLRPHWDDNYAMGAFAGETYSIYELPLVRFTQLALYALERSA